MKTDSTGIAARMMLSLDRSEFANACSVIASCSPHPCRFVIRRESGMPLVS
ncbi:Uncharacterised protein [Escherichia coli]|uniref:Uncharacterized protein n=1 Tax=Escherichia coli TaxID=562 RepID=A0A2X1N8Y0_ECOLX|nr:Uncharacterised protein [Escherichia coli]